MGRHLINPFSHTGIDVTGKHGHGPFVVTRANIRIPGAGVAGTVVHQVMVEVRRPPAPDGTTTLLPLVAGFLTEAGRSTVGTQGFVVPAAFGTPGLQGRILADRFAHGHGLVGIEQDVLIRAHAESTPGQTTVFRIVGGNPATHAEFRTGTAGKDLVLDGLRRIGVGHALFRAVGSTFGGGNIPTIHG